MVKETFKQAVDNSGNLKAHCLDMIENSREKGWVLEPDAKAIMALQGLDIPDFYLGNSVKEAGLFLKKTSSMVVAKCVSSKILHKTEYGAVVTKISTHEQLATAFRKFKQLPGFENVLVEEMVTGIEVLIGAKIDYQFGPVVMLGIGGTSVEIYKDTAIRMAPLKPSDVISMVNSLTGREMITGHRGQQGVDINRLTHLMVKFSTMVHEWEKVIESIDLNPVICTPDRCVIADARIIIKS